MADLVARNGSEAQLLRPVGDHKVYNIVHLIYRAKNYEERHLERKFEAQYRRYIRDAPRYGWRLLSADDLP
jgi:protein-S-isoprenylcysteine O-methyltransferase Ste14